MNLGDKKQANIYVPKRLHDLFVNIAKNTPFSVGDLYVMSASRILGKIPDIESPDTDYAKLGMEMYEKLNGGGTLFSEPPGDNLPDKKPIPKPSLVTPEALDSTREFLRGKIRKLAESSLSEFVKGKKSAQGKEKTCRDDDQYLWMMEHELEVWKPCFDKFTHLARVTAFASPTDDNLNSIVDEQENIYVITFMGYSNPKKHSYGVYDKEPLLSTNVGFFITTLICADPEGNTVYAGRSLPRKLFNQLSEDDLEKQALSTPEIMFTKPKHLSEEEQPFWGYCEGALSQLEKLFEECADFAHLESQLELDYLEGRSFLEILGLILVDHYGYWQYYLDNYEIKVAAKTFNYQGAEE